MDSEKKERIDLLYRNLEYNSHVYATAESAFPFWESAYALIIGQLFIAYFEYNFYLLGAINEVLDNPLGNYSIYINGRAFIAFFGLLLSVLWFILVSLNLKNANYMDLKLRESHELLRRELNCNASNVGFIEIYPSKFEKDKWGFWDIFWGKKPDEKLNLNWLKVNLKSTWFYRRILPFVMIIVWIELYILAYSDHTYIDIL